MTPKEQFEKITAMPDTVQITRAELLALSDVSHHLFNSDMTFEQRWQLAKTLNDKVLAPILARPN